MAITSQNWSQVGVDSIIAQTSAALDNFRNSALEQDGGLSLLSRQIIELDKQEQQVLSHFGGSLDSLKQRIEDFKADAQNFTGVDLGMNFTWAYKDAYDKKRAYLATANTCILKEKVNDLEEETFDKVTWVNRDENSFNGKYIDGIQDSVKTEHATKANAFGLAVASFFVHKNRFEHLADHDDAADDPKVKKDVWAAFGSSLIRLDNELDDDWDELYSAQIRPPKPSSNYLDVRDPSDLYVNKTFLKRKWALLFLLKLSEKDSKYASALKLSYVDTDLTEDRLCDNFKWSKMISNIQFLSTHPFLGSLINSLKDPFLKKLDMTAWMHTFRDRDMWADKEGGQILFSDSSEKTSALENLQQGDASSYIEANQYTIAALKKALSSIN